KANFMKYLFLSAMSLILLSCVHDTKQHTNFREIIFKDKSFEQAFRKSLKDLESTFIEGDKNTILEFYIDPYYNYDTVIAIRNCPPTNVKDLISVKKYKQNNVYIYCGDNLRKRLNQLIEINDETISQVCLKPVTSEFECIYFKLFRIGENKQLQEL
ncbi:hypothetical protein, partial [Flavobacterium sp.]|uniref:hypothetical protein n=1 Tax=Flavobacterium sp. TaxID=239 RepID=UPI00260F27DC